MRTYAPAEQLGFKGFSPYTLPNVIEIAEGIPFIDLTDWDHEKLYDLKGDVVARGIKAVTGMDMPVFPKRRFQHGAVEKDSFIEKLPQMDAPYRKVFQKLFD